MKSKKHLENEERNEMIIPEKLFKKKRTPIRKKKKLYNTKTLKQIPRENIKLNEKELDEELAKK